MHANLSVKQAFGSAILMSMLAIAPAQAFDVGYEKSISKQAISFKLETVVERYYRTLQAPTEDIARAWYTEGLTPAEIKAQTDSFTENPYLTGEIHDSF